MSLTTIFRQFAVCQQDCKLSKAGMKRTTPLLSMLEPALYFTLVDCPHHMTMVVPFQNFTVPGQEEGFCTHQKSIVEYWEFALIDLILIMNMPFIQ